MIDDQTLLAKVMDVMGFAVAVVSFLGSFVGNRQLVKDRSSAIFDGLMVFLLQMSIKCPSNLVELVVILQGYRLRGCPHKEPSVLSKNRQKAGWVYQLSKVTGKVSCGRVVKKSLSICCAKSNLL